MFQKKKKNSIKVAKISPLELDSCCLLCEIVVMMMFELQFRAMCYNFLSKSMQFN